MKGFSKPIRTYAAKNIYLEETAENSVIHHEKEGFSITIDQGRISTEAKSEVVKTIKSVLSRLED